MPNNNSVTKEDRLWRLSRTTTIAVFAIVLLVSLAILKPAAPDKITLLTGPEGGGYHELGKSYASYLRDMGLEVEVKSHRRRFRKCGAVWLRAPTTRWRLPPRISNTYSTTR